MSFAVFEWVGAAHYLLAGVLAGNVWEACVADPKVARRRTPCRWEAAGHGSVTVG